MKPKLLIILMVVFFLLGMGFNSLLSSITSVFQSISKPTSTSAVPFQAYTLIQARGLFPEKASGKGVEFTILRSRILDNCLGEPPWGTGYVFLELLPQITNQSKYLLGWNVELYDMVETRYKPQKFLHPAKQDCDGLPVEPKLLISPGESSYGIYLYEIPLALLDAKPHLQWRSDDLLLILDIFFDRSHIQFAAASPTPQLSPPPTEQQ